MAIPDGSRYTFNREEKKPYVETVLCRRDIASEDQRNYTYSYKSQMQSDKDSVRVEYVDQETNKKAFIERKVSNGQFVEGVGVNPVKIELPCIKEEYNAINRAELEIRKLYYLRETISDTFLPSLASKVFPGSLIRYEEVYSDFCIGGEIVAINGNELTLSEDIPDESSLYIEFTDAYGSPSKPQLLTKTGIKNCTIANTNGAYTANYDYSKGSMYAVSYTHLTLPTILLV